MVAGGKEAVAAMVVCGGVLWSNVLAGTDSITEIPPDRWSPERYGSPFKWGGFIPRTAFDPLAYGIPPTSLTSSVDR